MHKPHQQQILYTNLQLLKGTYRLEPPTIIPWAALASDHKLDQRTIGDSSINHSAPSEQLSCNAFSKTKQLFKRREQSSIVFDDFSNENIFSIYKKQEPLKTQRTIVDKFQFDSFGRQECLAIDNFQLQDKIDTNSSAQLLKVWNSQSIEINFDKVHKEDLQLPLQKPIVFQRNFPDDKNQSVDSIKEFCFKLSETSNNLEKTPIKKWSDCKKHVSRAKTQKGQQNKKELKFILQNFIDQLDQIKPEDLSLQLVSETKALYQRLRSKQKILQKKIHYEDNKKSDQFIIQQSSSTLRNSKQEETLQVSNSINSTKRKRIFENKSSQKNSKFRLYQCKDTRENKGVSKAVKKNKSSEKRFRF